MKKTFPGKAEKLWTEGSKEASEAAVQQMEGTVRADELRKGGRQRAGQGEQWSSILKANLKNSATAHLQRL